MLLPAFLVLMSGASAQNIQQMSADNSGAFTNSFITTDEVYATGPIAGPANTPVCVWAVADKLIWQQGDPLNDLSPDGANQVVLDGAGSLPLTSIWKPTLKVGDYDIVITLVDNDVCGNTFSLFFPVDDMIPPGFSVQAAPTPPPQPGGADAGVGSDSPGDHGWFYDPLGNPYNEMLQIVLTEPTNNEDVQVQSITIDAFGSGDDDLAIQSIDIVEDDGSTDGVRDDQDTVLGSGSYNSDDGTDVISISNLEIPQGGSVDILISYVMTNIASQAPSTGDTFEFDVSAISATGVTTGQSISVANLPISSAVKRAIAPPCRGMVSFNINPGAATEGESLTGTVSNLLDCSGETLTVHDGLCTGPEVCNFPVTGTGGTCSFPAPSTTQNVPQQITCFTACVDIDGDGSFTGAGEQDQDCVTVTKGEPVDSDGDGLNDGDEIQQGTDPNNPDTDGDGVLDGIEIEIGRNPLQPERVLLSTANLVILVLVILVGSGIIAWALRRRR